MTAPDPMAAFLAAIADTINALSAISSAWGRFATELVSTQHPAPAATHPAARYSLDDWDTWAEFDKVTGAT